MTTPKRQERETPARDNARGGALRENAPVFRPELERLEAQRHQPTNLLTLTPEGMRQVVAGQDRQREARISEIAAGLGKVKELAATDFAVGQMRDVAKKGFDRSR